MNYEYVVILFKILFIYSTWESTLTPSRNVNNFYDTYKRTYTTTTLEQKKNQCGEIFSSCTLLLKQTISIIKSIKFNEIKKKRLKIVRRKGKLALDLIWNKSQCKLTKHDNAGEIHRTSIVRRPRWKLKITRFDQTHYLHPSANTNRTKTESLPEKGWFVDGHAHRRVIRILSSAAAAARR